MVWQMILLVVAAVAAGAAFRAAIYAVGRRRGWSADYTERVAASGGLALGTEKDDDDDAGPRRRGSRSLAAR